MSARRRDLAMVIALTAPRLIAEGFIPVPITPGKKTPASGPGWPDIRYTQEDDLDQIFTERHGVGLNLENLVDIDLDSSWARKLAPAFLPATDMIWGRQSSPRSHYAYRVTGTVEHKTYERPDRSMLLERRTGKGHQSVVPPSLHPSGELITWANGHHTPTTVAATTLCQT